MRISAHFEREEFEPEGAMPDDCVPAFTSLCLFVLEPIRTQFNEPMKVTSGWRSKHDNTVVNGDLHSEHVASPRWCAADWYMLKFVRNMRPVFDWIRKNPTLPYHIVTLEHSQKGDIIHTSWHADMKVRLAKEGLTNNQSAMTNWPTVPLTVRV